MSNVPIRFGKGAGLEKSSAELTQVGLQRLENARIDSRDVISKRIGTQQVARTTTDAPTDELPVESLRAIWHREDELILEAQDQIYSRRECAGDATIVVGTATVGEIQTVTDGLNDNQYAYFLDVPVSVTPPSPASLTSAYDRLVRVSQSATPKNFVNGPHSTTAQISFATQPPRLTWSGGTVAPGFFELATGAKSTQFRFAFSVGSSSLAYLAVCVNSPAPGSERVDVVTYTVELTAGGDVEVIEVERTIECVGGRNGLGAWELDESGTYILQEPFPGTYRIRQPLNPGSDLDVTSYLGWPTGYQPRGVYFDCRDAGGPVRFVALPYDVSVAGGGVDTSRAVFLDGNFAGSVPVPIASAAYVVGVSNTLGQHCIGFRSASVPGADWAIKRSGTTPVFADVTTGDFSIRYRYTFSVGVNQTYVINTTQATTQNNIVLPGVVTSARYAVDESTGSHIWTGLSTLNNAYTTVYTGGGTVTVTPSSFSPLGSTHAVAASFDVASSTFGHFALRNSPETRMEVRSSLDLATWSQSAILNDGTYDAEVEQKNQITGWVEDVGGGNVRVVGTIWWGDPTLPRYKKLTYWSYDSATATTTIVREPTIDRLERSSVQWGYQSGPWPRYIWGYIDRASAREIYEGTPTYFTRVDPPLVALAGGNWTPRGPWTRSDLRVRQMVDWGSAYVIAQSAAAQATSPATGDPCTLSLVDLRNGTSPGVHAVVYSTHAESGGPTNPVLLGANYRAPLVASVSDDLLAFSLVSTDGSIFYQFWNPGTSFSLLDSAYNAASAAFPVYSIDAGPGTTTAENWMVLTALVTGNQIRVSGFRDDTGEDFSAIRNISSGEIATAVDCYVMAATDNTLRFLVVAGAPVAGGGYTFQTTAYTYNGASLAVEWSRLSVVAGAVGDQLNAITVGALDGTFDDEAQVCVEWRSATTGDRQVSVYTVDAVSETLVRVEYRSALFANITEINGQLVHGTTAVEFAGQNSALRSGLYVQNPETGEVIARINSLTGSDTMEDYVTRASLRTSLSRMNRYQNSLVLGYQAQTTPQQPTRQKFAAMDLTPRPHRPANLQSLAVTAHGGYPRAYDGAQVFEQDWHELAEITAIGTVAGSISQVGRYGIAVCWEWIDAGGNLHRSAPAFGAFTVTVPNVSFLVTVRPLTLTEKTDVALVAWRTLANGIEYYRATSIGALQPDAATNLVQLTLSDTDTVISTREILDQVADGASVFGQPTAISGWCAAADRRLWGPDPERPSLIRFSTFRTEGYGVIWNAVNAVELPESRAGTAVADADSRVVAWDAFGAFAWPAGGPTNAGQGTYAEPSRVPSATGATNLDGTVVIPDGFVFATDGVPYLLTRGLQTMEFAGQIDRVYEREAEEAQTAYWHHPTRSLRLGNGPIGGVYRWHGDTNRWAQDVGYSIRDESTGTNGEDAVLAADGRVLVRRPNDTQYTDGDAAYTFLVSTPWIRPALLGPADPATNSFSFAGFSLLGQWRGTHGLRAAVYYDFSSTPEFELLIPEERVTAVNDDGRAWRWTWRPATNASVYAVRIEVSDLGEPNDTFALEAIDVEITGDGSSEPATPPPDQWFEADE